MKIVRNKPGFFNFDFNLPEINFDQRVVGIAIVCFGVLLLVKAFYDSRKAKSA